MNHKSCEHEANPSTECEVCGKSIDNVRKHTKKIHEDPKLLRFPPVDTTASSATPEAENKNEGKNGDEENNQAEPPALAQTPAQAEPPALVKTPAQAETPA